MTCSKNKRGMTLVEVIIAMAIISIVFVVFISAISSGYINLIIMGNKSKAVAEAQSMIDYVESSSSFDLTTFPKVNAKVDISVLQSSTYDAQKPIYYSVEEITLGNVPMKRITILVYYHNGGRHEILSSVVNP